MEKIIIDNQLKENSKKIKKTNIDFFSNLVDKGSKLVNNSELVHGKIERRLLLKEFETGEKLYIQYPGKEVNRTKNRGQRPWDFRPKLQLSTGEFMDDLSFRAIWDDIFEIKKSNVNMAQLATVFFRIAYTQDLKLITRTLEYEDINPKTGNVLKKGSVKFTWYEYNPDSEILQGLNIPSSAIRNSHLLPYLSYNDYLAQNEDCKYYYRAKHEKNEEWDSDVGRRNTLLTHMSVIAFLEDKLKFSKILGDLSRRGVAPLTEEMCEIITEGRVTKS